MYSPKLPATGLATVTALGFAIESSLLYVLLGVTLVLVGFRFLRLIHKENKQ